MFVVLFSCLSGGWEVRRQKTEDGSQKTEVRRRKSEDGRQKTEDGRQKTEDGRQKTEYRIPKTEVRSSFDNFFYPMKVDLSGQLFLFKSLLISRNKFQNSTFFSLLTSVFWLFKTNPTEFVAEPKF